MQIIRSDQSNRNVIENMMQLYLHDLSAFTHEFPDKSGLFSLGKYFGLYWGEEDRFPYILLKNDQPIGFALVRVMGLHSHSIAEFFVLKTYRKQGFATKFAHDIFRRHPGEWSVAQLKPHVAAQSFWRKTISSYTKSQFTETWSNSQPCGPMQTFESPA